MVERSYLERKKTAISLQFGDWHSKTKPLRPWVTWVTLSPIWPCLSIPISIIYCNFTVYFHYHNSSLFIWKSELHGVGGREVTSICWFTRWTIATASQQWADQSQDLGALSRCPMWAAGVQTLAPYSMFLRSHPGASHGLIITFPE